MASFKFGQTLNQAKEESQNLSGGFSFGGRALFVVHCFTRLAAVCLLYLSFKGIII